MISFNYLTTNLKYIIDSTNIIKDNITLIFPLQNTYNKQQYKQITLTLISPF